MIDSNKQVLETLTTYEVPLKLPKDLNL